MGCMKQERKNVQSHLKSQHNTAPAILGSPDPVGHMGSMLHEVTNQKARVHKILELAAAKRRMGNSGADGGRCSSAW